MNYIIFNRYNRVDTRLPNSPIKIDGMNVNPGEVDKPMFNGNPMRSVSERDIQERGKK